MDYVSFDSGTLDYLLLVSILVDCVFQGIGLFHLSYHICEEREFKIFRYSSNTNGIRSGFLFLQEPLLDATDICGLLGAFWDGFSLSHLHSSRARSPET